MGMEATDGGPGIPAYGSHVHPGQGFTLVLLTDKTRFVVRAVL